MKTFYADTSVPLTEAMNGEAVCTVIKILSHRGYWKSLSEKNSRIAFQRSFDLGFGTETDLRDTFRDGSPAIVISHDVPLGQEISIDELFGLVREAQTDRPGLCLPLALNIKADGLVELLHKKLREYKISDYYVFDMSVPQLISYTKAEFRCYSRASEFEMHPSLYDHSAVVGIWLDAFTGRWYDETLLRHYLSDGKEVTIVSPELHGRIGEFQPFLNWLIETELHREGNISLCTDLPEDARAILHSK